MTDPVASLNAALEGRYLIERELGRGGMATVYLADDLKHDRKVALKVLKPELAAVVGAERFLAEIKTTANLQHPHILPLFDSGEADSFLYYVMPYVEGETLREKIDREKQLPVDEAVRIAIAVAHALQVAHDAGVIHRDIKPGNILLSRGEPLVADFGIALAVGAASGTRLTETGLSIGTPYYMSPEQATGDQIVGSASDTYAIACVLFEMLTGDPPYSGSTAQAVLGKIIQGVPVSATAVRKTVPANVDAAVRKALEKLPADRFTSAQEFSNALSDPGFRYGATGTAEGGAQTVRWKRTAAAFATLFAVAASVAVWAVGKPVPTPVRPVERFAQPFRSDQTPTSGVLGLPVFTLSRDGSTLVYLGAGEAGTANPLPHLRVRRWDALESTALPSTGSVLFPSISPDGRNVAFGSLDLASAMASIEVVPLGGGPGRSLAPGFLGYSYWGDDDYVYLLDETGAAARIPSAGGAVEVLTEIAAEAAGRIHLVSELVRGNEVALYTSTTQTGATPEMRALDLLTGESTVIGRGGFPSYAPTGHLIYISEDSTLMAAQFDEDRLELIGSPVAMMDGIFWFTLSDTGKLFYQRASSSDTEHEFVWVTRDGAAVPAEQGWTLRDGTDTNRRFSLSPDGSQLAYRALQNGNFDIWVKNLGGGAPTRLTFSEAGDRRPTWTPDGKRVTFLSFRQGDMAVFSKASDGAGVTELVYEHEVQLGDAVWSPDGASLIIRTFTGTSSGNGDILVAQPGGDVPPRALLAEAHQELHPAVSPNGRWLAYHSYETGQPEVFVTPLLAGETGKWQVSTGGGTQPHWSSDGTEIFFFNQSELVAAQVESEGTFRVIERVTLFSVPSSFLPTTAFSGPVYDVAADGRFIMAREVGSEEMAETQWVLVNNWLEEVKARVGN